MHFGKHGWVVMDKSLFEEIEQAKTLFTQDFDKKCACVMRRNYYALETSSIKESFDSDVFSLYDDHKYDSVERPQKRYTFNELSIDEPLPALHSTKDDFSYEQDDSFDSVISNFKSFIENPIITNDFNRISDLLRKYRESSKERLTFRRNSIAELHKVRSKVKEINDLDYNVNSLIFKAVEVHTDILVSGQVWLWLFELAIFVPR